MSKKQQLYNLIMSAYSGLPEAASIASHHMNAVSEKMAMKHWQAHGATIQAEANARRAQLRMQNAPKAPVQKPAPIAPTTQLASTLKAGTGGVRASRTRTPSRKVKDTLSVNRYQDAIGQTFGNRPIGASLNLT